MEVLQENGMLKFNNNTLKEVRNLFDLDQPGAMKDAVDILEEWIKQQKHFTTTDFGRGYLESIIITTKGSVEKAKTRLDKSCTFRTLMPQFFGDYDVKEYFKEHYYKRFTHAILPRLTKDNHRIILMKVVGNVFDAKSFLDYYRKIIIVKYLRAHDYAAGYIFIVDYFDLSLMDFLLQMNPVTLRQVMTIMMEGYGVRIKGIHILTPSKIIDGIVIVFKQVLSAKVGERILVHKDIEALHKHVQKDILPKEYGGEEKTLKELHDDWLDILASEEYTEYQRKMNRARTNENMRQTDKFNDEYMGMPGTFRKINLD